MQARLIRGDDGYRPDIRIEAHLEWPELYFSIKEVRRRVTEQVVTTHRDGLVQIKNPRHGETGWHRDQHLIFSDRWRDAGWYTLADYQKLKVLGTRRLDYRVISPEVVAGASSNYVSPTYPLESDYRYTSVFTPRRSPRVYSRF